MFVPFISSRSSSSSKARNLERRKGGGGRGGGGGGGRSSGGSKSSGGSSGRGSTTSSRSKSSSVSLGGSKSKSTVKTTTYSSASARIPPVAVIPHGMPFAGRTEGGAGRAQVFGSRYYGSGYPGVNPGRGTAGRNFPFFFWPVVWPTTLGFGVGWYGWYGPYYDGRRDYGDPTNSTRPGGPLVVATLQSSTSTNPAATFRILSDNFTVYSLISDISSNCTSHKLLTPINDIISSVTPYTDSTTSIPRPENVVQYYRASSISLSLDGYNNSNAAYSYQDGVADAPITGLNAGDLELMTCLNETIGLAAPLKTMFVPFFSKRKLERRKGGGGRGGGSRSSSSSKSSSSGSGGNRAASRASLPSSSSSKSSTTSSRSKSSSFTPSPSRSSSSGKTWRTTTYSSSSARVPTVMVIPAGQPFAGRTEGGGGRAQVFGTKIYGSGYPGVSGRGTLGRSFPFFFWPVVWPATLGAGYLTYLTASRADYGDTTNSTRPGGPLFVATFVSSAPTNPAINFRLLSDNYTIHSLIPDISAECSSKHLLSSIDTITASVVPFADTNTSIPRPENVIQYYRASSLALALDGYNNTAIFSDTDSVDTQASDSPIQGLADGDWELLNCLNTTIGAAAPLVSAGQSWKMPMGSMGLGNGVLGLPLVVGVVLASLLG
ncbi:hypothetical protein CVT24_000684 [Panaeolus cyanescens]|uniref:Uncharacterized protein n=1 Tax=Panaeolus cyanescens TaxID=181874 RepID=A0A409VWI1_9AGAR|nr:hypothetical protein CVT24_000684 [Panaeolus cyanescens]